MAIEAFQNSSWKTYALCKGICGAGMDSRYRSGRSTRKKPCAGILPECASAGGQTATIHWQSRPAHQVRGLSGGVTKQAELPARKNRQLPLRVQLPLHRKQKKNVSCSLFACPNRSSLGGTIPGCAVCRLFGYVWGCVSPNRNSFGDSIPAVQSVDCLDTYGGVSLCTSVIRYRLIRFLPWIVKPILKRSFRNGCSSTC